MGRARTILFWVITALVIPALFFVFLESGLRLIGYGKSYDYFTKIQIGGAWYLQDNPVFGLQFFPVGLNRTPLENTFPAIRPENNIRVFIFGGSAAWGFPDPNHGFARLLETMLTQTLPGRRIQVVNTAMTAINSHVVYEIAKAVPAGAADFAIILMGNNEVVGPYGPGTVFAGFSGNLSFIRFSQWLKRLRIGQGVSALEGKWLSGDAAENAVWQGMEMFSKNEVTFWDPRLQDVYGHFRRNLVDIVEMLQRKGARVLLSNVPVNLQDSAPFASVHKPDLSAEDLEKWTTIVGQADASFAAGNWSKAVLQYEEASAIDTDYAETHFRLGTCYLKLKNRDSATRHFEFARDLDALRFRADSQINDVIRSVGERFHGEEFTFLDSESAFYETSRPGLPGWNLFHEHVHYNFDGNYLLAQEFAAEIMKSINVTDSFISLSKKEVARRVGYPDRMTVQVMKKLVKMVGLPPFSEQSNRIEQRQHLREQYLQTKQQVGSVTDQISRYQTVLAAGVGDWRMNLELATLLAQTGDESGAYQQLQYSLKENPHDLAGHRMMARLLRHDGRFAEEIAQLKTALNYTRGNPKSLAHLDALLGTAYYNAGQRDAAVELLTNVAGNNPDFARITFGAYELLVQIAKQSGWDEKLGVYVAEVQRYGRQIIAAGQDDPWVYEKLVSILRLAGFDTDAEEWARKAEQPHSAVTTGGS